MERRSCTPLVTVLLTVPGEGPKALGLRRLSAVAQYDDVSPPFVVWRATAAASWNSGFTPPASSLRRWLSRALRRMWPLLFNSVIRRRPKKGRVRLALLNANHAFLKFSVTRLAAFGQ